MTVHPILPGAYCVPSALQALTGADYESVIMPALNRAARNSTLLGPVGPAHMSDAYVALRDMGYAVRRYRSDAPGGALRARLRTWAARSSERYPGRAFLVGTCRHALVVADGLVYDTFTPHGGPGAAHPYANDIVVSVALVERTL